MSTASTGTEPSAPSVREPWIDVMRGSAVLASLTLLTSPVSAVPTLNWVYWTLSAKVFFYLAVGLLLFAPAPRRLLFLAGLHAGLCLAAALRDLAPAPERRAALARQTARLQTIFETGLEAALMTNRPTTVLLLP